MPIGFENQERDTQVQQLARFIWSVPVPGHSNVDQSWLANSEAHLP